MPSKRRASVKASSGSPKPTSPKKVKLTEEPQPTPLSSPKGASSKEIGDHEEVDNSESRFLGEPLPADEARERWPHRYQEKVSVVLIIVVVIIFLVFFFFLLCFYNLSFCVH